MDLAVGAKKLIALTEHTNAKEEFKIMKRCSYPITAKGCVDLIVTNLAMIEVTKEGLLLKEVAPGLTPKDVQAVTEPKLTISPELKEIEF